MATRYLLKIHSVPEHTIEFIRNTFTKTLKLIIDGKEADRVSCLLPGQRTLRANFVHGGVPRGVVATSVPHRLLWTKETIEVDGQALTLTRMH